MWILQRICEEGPFYPFHANFNDFKRGVAFYNSLARKYESALAEGKLVSGLGLDFGLYKGPRPFAARVSGGVHRLTAEGVVIDLVVVSRLVKDAKANIIELEHEQAPDLEENSSTLSPQ